MIIYTTNILAVPLLLVVWAIDMFLGLSALRLLMGRNHALKNHPAGQALVYLTDPIHQAVAQRLAAWRGRPLPSWASWTILIIAATAVQQLLVGVIMIVSSH